MMIKSGIYNVFVYFELLNKNKYSDDLSNEKFILF